MIVGLIGDAFYSSWYRNRIRANIKAIRSGQRDASMEISFDGIELGQPSTQLSWRHPAAGGRSQFPPMAGAAATGKYSPNSGQHTRLYSDTAEVIPWARSGQGNRRDSNSNRGGYVRGRNDSIHLSPYASKAKLQ